MTRTIFIAVLFLLSCRQAPAPSSTKSANQASTDSLSNTEGITIINDSTAFRKAMESCTLREVDFSHPLAGIPEPANNFIDSATHLHIRSGHIAQMPVGVAGNQALVFRFTHTAEAPSNAIVELLGPAACHGIWFNYGEYNGKAVPFILVLTYTDDTRQLVPFTTPATPPAGSLESFGVKTGKEIKGASMLLTGESSLIIDNLKY